MTQHSFILAVYSVAILIVSLLGGMIPRWVKLTHERTEIAVSFVAGVMLGMALLHLIPHASEQLASIDGVMVFLLCGFLVMFFVERFFCFHHHGGEGAGCGHEHHAHDPSWSGVVVGFVIHTLLGGMALAASVAFDAGAEHRAIWPGFGTFLVIFLHKPFDSLTIGMLMTAKGAPSRWRHAVNAGFALMVPLGVLLFYWGLALSDVSSPFIGATLAFSAGVFLCIAMSDLLPELQFHRHDRIKLSFSMLTGIALAWGLEWLERF